MAFALPAAASDMGSEAALFAYSDGAWAGVGTAAVEQGIRADLDGDGTDELLLGGAVGELPWVRVYKPDVGTVAEFLVFDSGMVRGFDMAAGDLDGDGISEIAVTAGIGTNGHLRILDMLGGPKFLPAGLFPFGRDGIGGAFVSIGDLDGDGTDELVVGSGPGTDPKVQAWGFDGRGYLGEFAPWDDGASFGARPAVGDLDGDGRDELAVAQAFGGSGEVHLFDGLTFSRLSVLHAFGEDFVGGAELSISGGALSAVAAPGDLETRPWLPQFIRVSIDGQRLYAYSYGEQVRTTLVSTGRSGFDTPTGEYTALAKPEYVHYKWSFGEDNPENYDLGLVRWNVRFFPHYYIHNSPWHNNFGRRMSHGCVNVAPRDAEWVWNWIGLGTPITIEA